MGKGGWVVATIEDEVLRYTYEPHKPVKSKAFPWLYCQYCGLLYLKNRPSRRAVKLGCNYNLKRR